VHLGATYLPLGQRLLRTEPVGPAQMPVLFALSLTVFVALELHKLHWRRRRAGRA
jgi:hypothetical protein